MIIILDKIITFMYTEITKNQHKTYCTDAPVLYYHLLNN